MRELLSLRSEIEERAQQLESLELELQKEAKDVEKLESFSLQNLIQTFLGKKEKQLEKEQLEELSARLKYETAVQLLDILRSEEQGLLNRIEPLSSDDAALEELLNPLSDKLAETEQLASKWEALQKFLKK